jgi:predicted alpha-1,2-mannosidase
MKLYLSLLYTLLLSGCSMTRTEKYADYVNPLIGTDIQKYARGDKAPSEEKGQTMPAVGIPNGMTNWVPQTLEGEHKCNPPYYYYHNEIQGFRASHWISGSCMQDYGSVTIMPLSGELKTDVRERASRFSHDTETARPYYYQVILDDYQINAELTGLSRAGLMRFGFPTETKEDRYIVIEPNSDKKSGYLKIDSLNKEITGYNPAHRIYQGNGKSAGFSGYFVIRFEDSFDSFGTWKDDEITDGQTEVKGDGHKVGAWLKLAPTKDNSVQVKIGTSFTSIENARKNLETEIPGWNFETVKKQSAAKWEEALSRIVVKSDDNQKKTQFYTALYNARMLPRTFSDAEGYYPGFSENYTTHRAEDFTYYCDFSMWDIYRAVLPLYSILSPSAMGDFSKSFLVKQNNSFGETWLILRR